MPPKAQLSREDILDKALELTRAEGFDSLTARRLAKALGCSTQPVFRAFQTMEELKAALYLRARDYAQTCIMSRQREDEPRFLSMGLAYVDFAAREKQLMRFISMSDCFSLDSMQALAKGAGDLAVQGVPELAGMSPQQAGALFSMTWIFTHGIAAMVATNSVSIPEETLKKTLTSAYLAFARELEREHHESTEQ